MTQVYLGCAIGLIIYFSLYILEKSTYKKHSHLTKKFPTRIFRSHGRLKQFVTLENVQLLDAVADQVYIGYFGVILACDLHNQGNIYGDHLLKEWSAVIETKNSTDKQSFPSPLLAVQKCETNFRKMLADNKIYNVPIQTMVIKTQNQQLNMASNQNIVFSTKELKSELERVKYDKDNGVDITKIKTLLEQTSEGK